MLIPEKIAESTNKNWRCYNFSSDFTVPRVLFVIACLKVFMSFTMQLLAVLDKQFKSLKVLLETGLELSVCINQRSLAVACQSSE